MRMAGLQNQAPVIQRVDTTVTLSITIRWMTRYVFVEICLLDSTLQPWNNQVRGNKQSNNMAPETLPN